MHHCNFADEFHNVMNGYIHRPIGAAAGATIAAVRANGQSSEITLLESLGGLVGGIVGGSLPDWVEPATWPGHRSFFHSLLAGGVSAANAINTLTRWESFCREKAESARARMCAVDASEWQRFCIWIAALLWQIAAGLLAGLLGGYASHLVLDSMTPAGLPFVA